MFKNFLEMSERLGNVRVSWKCGHTTPVVVHSRNDESMSENFRLTPALFSPRLHVHTKHGCAEECGPNPFGPYRHSDCVYQPEAWRGVLPLLMHLYQTACTCAQAHVCASLHAESLSTLHTTLADRHKVTDRLHAGQTDGRSDRHSDL